MAPKGLPKLQRQGIRKRLGLTKKEPTKSDIGNEISGLYFKTKVTPSEAAGLASAASSSGCGATDVRALAKCQPKKLRTRKGKTKPDTRHSARDVRRTISKSVTYTLPPCYTADVPCWDEAANKPSLMKVSFLLPYEVLDM